MLFPCFSALVGQAKKWGHKAIAITDHAGAQSFPEAFSAGKKNDIKILYGVEVNLVNDGVPIAYNDAAYRNLADATYVVFDVETTGLSAVYDTIIEFAAVKIRDGEIIDRFESFANPHQPLSATIIESNWISRMIWFKMHQKSQKCLEKFHRMGGRCSILLPIMHPLIWDF